jgi:hypothetical protein
MQSKWIKLFVPTCPQTPSLKKPIKQILKANKENKIPLPTKLFFFLRKPKR